MLLRSPISQAAQVRQGQDGGGVPGVGCQTPTEASAAGADTGVAVRGCPGPACQPHAGAGAVPGAAGQGCASTVSGVQVGAGRELWGGGQTSSHPVPPHRLLWYPEGGHALAGVEMEANVFKNCAHWLLQHLGQPRQDETVWHSP